METFAEKIIRFNKQLHFDGTLPEGIRIMNPYADNENALEASSLFYRKYYADNQNRRLILGINPGRFGAGVTGVPFTDTLRLKEICGITLHGTTTRETSSIFVYDFIEAFGGTESFYRDYYISAVCPLGFVKRGPSGKDVNYNYYDSRELTLLMEPFIVAWLEQQLHFGINRELAFCLGTGKNFEFLTHLNDKYSYFHKIIPLEHPRFIMQYKLRQKDYYIRKYVDSLRFL